LYAYAYEGEPRARVGTFPRAQRRRALFGRDLGGPSQHRELELGLAIAVQQGDAVVASLGDACGPRFRVDTIRDRPRRAGNADPEASIDQPQQIVGLKVDRRTRIDVERAAVSEEDFDAPVGGSQPIAAQERHVERRGFRTPIALERGAALDDRDVGGRTRVRILRARRRGVCKQETENGRKAGEKYKAAVHGDLNVGQVGNQQYSTDLPAPG
jgi:hypothetical protein